MNPAVVAKIMCSVTDDLLWKPRVGWAKKQNPTAALRLRVGSGMKTYVRHKMDTSKGAQMVLTYGTEMIVSKSDKACLSLWTTGREVSQRGYYNGELSLLNVLAQTIVHEFGHVVQIILGRRYKGSVHNAEFYQILDRIHSSGEAEKIRNELNERCLAFNIDLSQVEASHSIPDDDALSLSEIRTNERLWFKAPKLHAHNPVLVTKVLRKRIAVKSEYNPKLMWTGPPTAFSKSPTGL